MDSGILPVSGTERPLLIMPPMDWSAPHTRVEAFSRAACWAAMRPLGVDP